MKRPTHLSSYSCQKGRHRSAAILILLLFILPAVIILVGFSVDVAHMMRVRSELRSAVDMAAKAGANALSETQDTAAATLVAQQVAAANNVAGEPLTLDAADIVFGRSSRQNDGSWQFVAGATPFNAMRVNGRRTNDAPDGGVPLYFGLFYGQTNYEPESTSTATVLDVDICLVLDRSSSMKLATDSELDGLPESDPRTCQAPLADSRWIALDNGVDVFLNRIQQTTAQERVGVVTFASDTYNPCGETNTEVSLDQALTTDTAAVGTAIDAWATTVWNGGTYIDKGIEEAKDHLTGPQGRPLADKIMIVFTDGAYTGEDPRIEAQVAANENIIIHTITFGAGADQLDMQAVATIGNGQHYHATDVASLEDVFAELAASLAFLTE